LNLTIIHEALSGEACRGGDTLKSAGHTVTLIHRTTKERRELQAVGSPASVYLAIRWPLAGWYYLDLRKNRLKISKWSRETLDWSCEDIDAARKYAWSLRRSSKDLL